MSSLLPEFCLSRIENKPVRIEVTDDGSPIDLTGATVYVTAKQALADADEDAIADFKITEHVDAEGGITEIPFDFTGAAAEAWATPQRLVADVVVKDALGETISSDVFVLEIGPSVTRSTAD